MNDKSLTPREPRRSDPAPFFRRPFDQLFEDLFARDWGVPAAFSGGFMAPKVNVAETAEGLEVTAELPGVDQKDIDVDVSNGVLTLRAEHKQEREEKDEKKRFHIMERSQGAYLRRFALPFEPDAERIAATFENGVLKIALPRLANAREAPRKIEIRSK